MDAQEPQSPRRNNSDSMQIIIIIIIFNNNYLLLLLLLLRAFCFITVWDFESYSRKKVIGL